MRDSSLSATIQAIVAAEVGHLELAYDYFAETALIDFEDLAGNTRDGLHVASMAGAWLTAVAGFGGMRDHEGQLSFTPRLPPALERLAFKLNVRGTSLRVEIRPSGVTYTLLEGEELELEHEGERLVVTADVPKHRELRVMPELETPAQPAGRAPIPRAQHHRLAQQVIGSAHAATDSGLSSH